MYWQLTWRYIGPAMMSVLLVASVISMVTNSPEYGAWDAEKVKFMRDARTMKAEKLQIVDYYFNRVKRL